MADNVFAWTGGAPGSPAGHSHPHPHPHPHPQCPAGSKLDEWPTAFSSVNHEPITRPCNPNNPKDCGDAPTIWYDERVGKYMLLAQFGHRMPGTEAGYGSAYLSSSSDLAGPWKQEALPWLEQRGPIPMRGYPGVPGWNQSQEFLSVDFFQLPSSSSRYGFLETVYGITPAQYNTTDAYHDYAIVMLGPRPEPFGAFEPVWEQTAVLDWSPFTYTADNKSQSLTLATGHGMSQFSCCPKTGSAPGRVVLFNELSNGWDQGMNCQGKRDQWRIPGCENRTLETIETNNTLALPRDLTVAPDGSLRMAFVPELQNTRRQHIRVANLTLSAETVGNRAAPHFLDDVSGTQLEIEAVFTVPTHVSAGQFGLVVLSSGAEEYTAIAFDWPRKHVVLDRTKSGATGLQGDDDARAGPWIADDARAVNAGEVTVRLHAFVDNQIVSLIVDNQTAISAWVNPTREASDRLGLFSELVSGESARLVSLDAWRLER